MPPKNEEMLILEQELYYLLNMYLYVPSLYSGYDVYLDILHHTL